MDFQLIKNSISSSPAFVLDAEEIINTLKILNTLRHRCGCKVLYSIKSLPFSSVLDIVKPFVDGFSVSSLFEARLADEILAGQGGIHLTTPGIRPDEWDDLARLLTHISFNSLTQYQHFACVSQAQTSIGLRVNPKLSFLKDDRFDPCRPHSKLGVAIDDLWQSSCLDQVKGLHIHNVFSATDFTPLIKTLEKIRSYFGKDLAQLDWLNLGGGYLFNQIKDQRPFIDLVKKLKNDFDLEVYIEPGNATVGCAGHLLSTVIDSFVSDGKTVAILDTSVNHNPEVFEYQRQPELHEHDPKGRYSVILAGSTCLAGDVFGEYQFCKPLEVGDQVIFKNVGAYSMVKANRFNGYNLPDIYWAQDQQLKKLKHYPYEDYRRQWLAD
jgi:carboxynorspermidine decarboxylase